MNQYLVATYKNLYNVSTTYIIAFKEVLCLDNSSKVTVFTTNMKHRRFRTNPTYISVFTTKATQKLIPIVPEKMKRQKSFGHLSSPLRKTRLGSILLEKMVS